MVRLGRVSSAIVNAFFKEVFGIMESIAAFVEVYHIIK